MALGYSPLLAYLKTPQGALLWPVTVESLCLGSRMIHAFRNNASPVKLSKCSLGLSRQVLLENAHNLVLFALRSKRPLS
jgi:hypothetical protein